MLSFLNLKKNRPPIHLLRPYFKGFLKTQRFSVFPQNVQNVHCWGELLVQLTIVGRPNITQDYWHTQVSIFKKKTLFAWKSQVITFQNPLNSLKTALLLLPPSKIVKLLLIYQRWMVYVVIWYWGYISPFGDAQ